jgi:hypothetical protein
MTSFFINTIYSVHQNKDIKDHTTRNVGTMESCNGKEEVEKVVG